MSTDAVAVLGFVSLFALMLLRVPVASLAGPSTPIRFAVRSGGRIVQEVESAFLGPAGKFE